MICLYCKREKPIKEFSQEHILPRAIGGNLDTTNPFAIHDVCGRCNNLSGLFIDGPFIKSWFLNNYRAQIAQKYCHLTPQTVLPLTYFGEIADLKFGARICEFWFGPTGDPIYHFHEPYPQEPDTVPMVGVPPTAYNKDIDHGFVFLFVRSNNPIWHPTIIFSVIDNFKKSTLYLGNGNKPGLEQFEEIPDSLKEVHQKLKEMQGNWHNPTFSVGINFADRFLCKLALGIGSLILNPSFKESKSADLLRLGMWTKNIHDREKLPIRGSGLLGGNLSKSNLDQFLKWPGGHIFVVLKSSDQLALYSNFYEVNSGVIQISDEPEHFEDKINEGIVYIIAPTLNTSAGPIGLAEFIGHTIEPHYVIPSLRDLETEMEKYSSLPPFDI